MTRKWRIALTSVTFIRPRPERCYDTARKTPDPWIVRRLRNAAGNPHGHPKTHIGPPARHGGLRIDGGSDGHRKIPDFSFGPTFTPSRARRSCFRAHGGVAVKRGAISAARRLARSRVGLSQPVAAADRTDREPGVGAQRLRSHPREITARAREGRSAILRCCGVRQATATFPAGVCFSISPTRPPQAMRKCCRPYAPTCVSWQAPTS